MTLARPADWPPSLPPPLVSTQAGEVRQYLAATHEEVAVVVRCPPCGAVVGDIIDLTLVDDTGQGFYLPVRSVYRGTMRTSDKRLEVAKSGRYTSPPPGHTVKLPEKRPGPHVELDDQYLACLKIPSARVLPTWLPAWCDREGHLVVERQEVTLALALWRWKQLDRPSRVDARPVR